MNQTPRVVVTMMGPWPGPVDILDPAHLRPWEFLRRFVRLSRHADAVVLRGTSGLHEYYVELLAALWLKGRRLLGRRVPVTVMSDATWDVTSRRLEQRAPALGRLLPRVARLAVRSFDGPHMRYGVLSNEEKAAFPERWGIDASRVVFTPFCATMNARRRPEASEQGYVFAGGNSYRDYDLLIEAAAQLDVPVRIATSWRPGGAVPKNVTVRPLSPTDYDNEMLGASVVVVPIRVAARSAGQQTYLNAMMLGKVTVVTEAPGVRDHVEDGVTALVVPAAPEALARAIRRTMDAVPGGELDDLKERGRTAVDDNFHMSHYFSRLWSAAGLSLPDSGLS